MRNKGGGILYGKYQSPGFEYGENFLSFLGLGLESLKKDIFVDDSVYIYGIFFCPRDPFLQH